MFKTPRPMPSQPIPYSETSSSEVKSNSKSAVAHLSMVVVQPLILKVSSQSPNLAAKQAGSVQFFSLP